MNEPKYEITVKQEAPGKFLAKASKMTYKDVYDPRETTTGYWQAELVSIALADSKQEALKQVAQELVKSL